MSAWVEDATVEVSDVTKWFGAKVAVSTVSCSFGAGVTGLLGPNGAGKTTLLRLIVGLARPSRGSIRLLGRDPRRRPDVYRRVAMVQEEDAVYGFMTASDFVGFNARLAGVTDWSDAARRALAQVELTDVAERRLATFSKGMRQRAKVAAALVSDPDVLILDEPLNGTDPVQRARLMEMFVALGEAGRTVIVSSHVLGEVERMARRVIAMVDGRLAAAGTVTAIREAMSDLPRRVVIRSEPTRALGVALLREEWTRAVDVDGDAVRVEVDDVTVLARNLPGLARRIGARLTHVEPEDESLESVFRDLVQR